MSNPTLNRRPLRLFSAVWGDKHADWFERACVESLGWPKNRQVLLDKTNLYWTIFTKPQDRIRITEIAKKILPPERHESIQYYEMPQTVQAHSPEMGAILLNGLLHTMSLCLKEGSQLLTAPPDTIFGDGTVPNLLHIGNQDGTCVAVAHPRVSPSIFAQFKKGQPFSNPQLVTAAWKHLHKAMSEGEAGLQRSNSFVGGISWRKLPSDNSLVSVQHRLPTCYLASFTPGDITFFQQPHDGLPPTYGTWDHGWPGQCLIPQQRQRYVGSSDACFIIELTDEDKNVPPLMNGNPYEPDAFWRTEPHNAHNRQQCVIFRGE